MAMWSSARTTPVTTDGTSASTITDGVWRRSAPSGVLCTTVPATAISSPAASDFAAGSVEASGKSVRNTRRPKRSEPSASPSPKERLVTSKDVAASESAAQRRSVVTLSPWSARNTRTTPSESKAQPATRYSSTPT